MGMCAVCVCVCARATTVHEPHRPPAHEATAATTQSARLAAKQARKQQAAAARKAGSSRTSGGRRVVFQPLWNWLKKEQGWFWKKGSGLVNW